MKDHIAEPPAPEVTRAERTIDMKYRTVIDHYEVQYVAKYYDDRKPMVTKTDLFETEDEAIEFAQNKRSLGVDVIVRAVSVVCDW